MDALHAAVLAALLREARGVCSAAEAHAAARTAVVRRLAPGVALASVAAQCVCGAQNCPYYVVRYGGRAPEVLLSTFGIDDDVRPGSPLPLIVVSAHDSALVTIRTTYAYRAGRYVDVAVEQVRGDTGAAKPVQLPLRFVPGSDSAPLTGTVATGWGDRYLFRARAGQRLTVEGLRAPLVGGLLDARTQDALASVRSGVPVTLPRSGAYVLTVDTDGGGDARYALRVTIR